MRLRLFITVMGVLCLAGGGQASIIFRPGEKVKYIGPGEEEISGNAQQLYDKAQEAEKQGNMGRAIKAYTQLLKKHPKDALAPGATYRAAQLLEFEGDYMKAAMTYRWLVERYPSSPNFEEAIDAQFRIGEIIPLKLSFSSAARSRYQINTAQYDRSGRMDYERFELSPADGAVDPLPLVLDHTDLESEKRCADHSEPPPGGSNR